MSAVAAAAPGRLTVLMSAPNPPSNGNPYVSLLVESLAPEARADYFSWRRALTQRYDVFHVHWPETLVRGKTRPRSAGKALLFVAFIARLSVTRTAVVRTVHNRRPHESATWWEERLLRWLDRRVSTRIYMATDPSSLRDGDFLIPHGDYRSAYERRADAVSLPGRILFFGAIRTYKNVPALCVAFRTVDDPSLSLRVVGKPLTEDLAASVRDAAVSDRRISLVLHPVDSQTLSDEIAEAELVVLPFSDMENSGSALLALSLDRPVLVPSSSASLRLAEEVGSHWVQTFAPPLRSDDIVRAVEGVRTGRTIGETVHFSGRSWEQVGLAHLSAYRGALARTGADRD